MADTPKLDAAAKRVYEWYRDRNKLKVHEGTRQDWIDRCYGTEIQLDKIREAWKNAANVNCDDCIYEEETGYLFCSCGAVERALGTLRALIMEGEKTNGS
jgi:hypothetical protein